MFTTIITDCKGENEAGRQIARYASLGLGPANLVGIGSHLSADDTLEGSANLIDIIDATEGKKGVIVLNVAPRGDKKDGGNGTHFSYFYHKQTLVISTLKGYCLSLLPKFGITDSVNIVDLGEVLEFANDQRLLTSDQTSYIVKSQFRSFDFVPRLARWLVDETKVPSTALPLPTTHYPPCVWHIDAFGNAKLTLTNQDLPLKETPCKVTTNLGEFTFYERLKDVPAGETAIYTGSSGFGDMRLLELATQATTGSAAKTLNLKVGDIIKIQ